VWVESWPGGQKTWPKPGCHRRRDCATRREDRAHWLLTVGLVLTSYRRYSANPDEGWGVIDFCESRQHFDAFEPRIGAAVAAAGAQLQGPPDIKQFAVPRPSRVSARAVAT